METQRNGKAFATTISAREKRILHRAIKLLGPFVDLPKLGCYRSMSSEDLWFKLVAQVCVSGSARGFEQLANHPEKRDNFKNAVALSALPKQHALPVYLANLLRRFSVARFPKRSADRLVTILNTPTVFRKREFILFAGLSHKGEPSTVRDEIIRRCPAFRLKSASDFMITVGLSDAVIALDARVVGILRRHFAYNLTAGRVQSNKGAYLSLEHALRALCEERGVPLALLDRLFFQFDKLSKAYFLSVA